MTAFFLSVFVGLGLYGFDIFIHSTGSLVAWCVGCAIGVVLPLLWSK